MRRDYEGPIFGTTLTLLCERSGVEVPVILGDILRWLAAHALAQPDVFAEAPKCVATRQLKSSIDKGVPLVELVEGTHPAVVGSLLKRWLEELPDPLLSWDQQVELLSACKDEGCIEARIASLNDAVAFVDHIALGTLKPLLLFLQQYCFRQRRFDQQLLQVAVAFAPILFPAALAAGPAELRLAEETVATLVSNALHVFNPTLAANVPVVTPQALCEAAAEIMETQETQQQQPDESSLCGCAEVNGEGLGQSPYQNRAVEAANTQERESPLPEQANPEQANDGQYEPYLQDGPFLASFNEMVDSCVAGALFGPLEGCLSDHDAASWGVDDDCGSMTSSCSHIHLSSGGAASSGGASSCSTTSLVLSSQGDSCLMPQQPNAQHHHHHHHHQHDQHQHSHGRAKGAAQVGCPTCPQEGAHLDAPYSPRAVLLAPLDNDEDARSRGLKASPDFACQKVVVGGANAVSIHMAATGKTIATAHVTSAALAELAQREVSEGSVFCIISAQPVATQVLAGGVNPTAAAVSGAGKGSAGYQVLPTVSQSQQLQQTAAASACDTASCQLDSTVTARSATARRATEGGAAGGNPQVHTTGHLPNQEQLSGMSRVLGLHQPVGSAVQGEQRQRRITMGGDNQVTTTQPSPPHQQHPRLQQATLPQQLHPLGGGSVGSAVAALYQHLPQLRARLAGSSNSIAGAGGSGTSSGSSSSGGGSAGGGGIVSLQSTDRLPPTAGTPPSSVGGSYLADLGVAGHLRVTLTSGLTLAVRELSTPEAMTHRVPIRTMSAAAMQGEKERLKRQLKDLAAAYEAYSGRSLTQALKEPLRPVYVRYHKIKALLSSGRATQSLGTAGVVGVSASSGRPQQRVSSSGNMPSSSRQSVVA